MHELHIRLHNDGSYFVRVDEEEHGCELSQAELCELIAFLQPHPSVSGTPPVQVLRVERQQPPAESNDEDLRPA